jgi:hypothetical protein
VSLTLLGDKYHAYRARVRAQTEHARAEASRQARRRHLIEAGPKSASELHELRLLEAQAPYAPDWVGPMRDRLDTFRRSEFAAVLTTGRDRKYGGDFPFYSTEQDLGILRTASRLIARTNTKAEGLLYGLAGYVLGDGATVRVTPRGKANEACGGRRAGGLGRVRPRRRVRDEQETFFVLSRMDGEAFWRLFPTDGLPEVRFVWPEQIRQPPGTTMEEYGFGVKTDPDDAQKRLEYNVVPVGDDTGMDGEPVPADEMILVQPNALPGVRRSVPDFAFGMAEALEASEKLSTNMGEGSAIQAAIAYIRQHEGVPGESIRAFADADADYRVRDVNSGADRNVKRMVPGTIVDTNKNTNFLASPYNAGVAAHIDVVRLLDRTACVKYNAPEWLGSADASNNNFASSLTAESPFVIRVKSFQRGTPRPSACCASGCWSWAARPPACRPTS